MKKWQVQFDGAWMVSSGPTVEALRKEGYGVGSFRESDAVYTYALYHLSDDPDKVAASTVFETHDKDELNRYVNLILGPRE